MLGTQRSLPNSETTNYAVWSASVKADQGLEREAISEATPIAYLSGIAIGDGSLFVSNYPENRIYRIQF